MIIYITGYGRSGSTVLSQEIERKLNAVNLGEAKYLYRDDKDDLLDPYWRNFKEVHKKILSDRSDTLKKFDNIFGFLKWREKTIYKETWKEIFKKANLNIHEEVIIDSSKTTMDAFMRGIYLHHSFGKVLFVQPQRKLFDVIKSLLRGKNSNLERGDRKGKTGRFFHAILVGIPHLLLTRFLTQIYYLYGLEMISLNDIEEDVDKFIKRKGLAKGNNSEELPMIYGNRSRKNSS